MNYELSTNKIHTLMKSNDPVFVILMMIK